jgi:hypothetical protein
MFVPAFADAVMQSPSAAARPSLRILRVRRFECSNFVVMCWGYGFSEGGFPNAPFPFRNHEAGISAGATAARIMNFWGKRESISMRPAFGLIVTAPEVLLLSSTFGRRMVDGSYSYFVLVLVLEKQRRREN